MVRSSLTIMMISEIQILAKLKKTWDLVSDITICTTDSTIIHKDFLFRNLEILSTILNTILNTDSCPKSNLDLEMIQLVVQPVAMNSDTIMTLMLGMIFTVEVQLKPILIA